MLAVCTVFMQRVVPMMQVVLREDLPNLGTKGSIVAVPNGYFRNYLKPQNLASTATAGILECVISLYIFYILDSADDAVILQTVKLFCLITYLHCHRNIEKEKQRAEQKAREVKAKAKAMAVALSTIGKFVVKKKVGDGDKIFGR
jgi:large subunit ribosomal protein L9